MKPFYHEAAKLLREHERYKTDMPVVFAKVDATAEKALVSKFEITDNFPTIFIFRKYEGQLHRSEYEGPRQPAECKQI
jgi:hypothetical protein